MSIIGAICGNWQGPRCEHLTLRWSYMRWVSNDGHILVILCKLLWHLHCFYSFLWQKHHSILLSFWQNKLFLSTIFSQKISSAAYWMFGTVNIISEKKNGMCKQRNLCYRKTVLDSLLTVPWNCFPPYNLSMGLLCVTIITISILEGVILHSHYTTLH